MPSDLSWLWLWHRLAATPPIGPLAWELPYAVGAALKEKKKKKKGKRKKKKKIVGKVKMHILCDPEILNLK